MIRRLLKKLPKLLWFLPGFLLWASFPPMGEKMDCFFALAPLLWFARRHAPRRSFRCWFVNGFFFWFATLSWMPAIIKNGGPWPLVVLGWGVLAAYCALYFGAFGWLSATVWDFVRNRRYAWRLAALLIAEPVLWAGLELVRSRFAGGFAWNQLGVAPINAGLGAAASLGGVYLVSAIVILVNGTFASIAERIIVQMETRGLLGQPTAEPRVTRETICAEKEPAPSVPQVPNWARSVETLLPFLLIFGIHQLTKCAAVPETSRPTETVTFGLMQRNFPCVFKMPDADDDARIAYAKMVGALLRTRPEVIVLPESAFGEIGAVDQLNARRFAEGLMVRTGARAVIAGGARMDQEKRLYNSVALYQRDDADKPATRAEPRVSCDIYDKVHLVPFGEYIPGDKWITALQSLAPVGSCTAGELKPLRLTLEDGTSADLGVAICYEDTDSAQMRALAAQGVRALVFVTNDSWFSQSNETMQHAWQSVARAIETGLPVVRVGNSGVTGVIYPDGSAQWLKGENGQPLADTLGTMFAAVELAAPGAGPRTRYAAWGDTPLATLFLLLITAIGLVKYNSLRKTV